MKKQDKFVIAILRQQGRIPLTRIAKKTGIPVSTLFDKLKNQYEQYIKKQTCLLDFEKLGYKTKAYVLFKLKDKKEEFIQRLSKHHHVNTLFRVNNGWDVLAEIIFAEMKELETFLDAQERDFPITEKTVHYILEEVMRENFMSQPQLAELY